MRFSIPIAGTLLFPLVLSLPTAAPNTDSEAQDASPKPGPPLGTWFADLPSLLRFRVNKPLPAAPPTVEVFDFEKYKARERERKAREEIPQILTSAVQSLNLNLSASQAKEQEEDIGNYSEDEAAVWDKIEGNRIVDHEDKGAHSKDTHSKDRSEDTRSKGTYSNDARSNEDSYNEHDSDTENEGQDDKKSNAYDNKQKGTITIPQFPTEVASYSYEEAARYFREGGSAIASDSEEEDGSADQDMNLMGMGWFSKSTPTAAAPAPRRRSSGTRGRSSSQPPLPRASSFSGRGILKSSNNYRPAAYDDTYVGTKKYTGPTTPEGWEEPGRPTVRKDGGGYLAGDPDARDTYYREHYGVSFDEFVKGEYDPKMPGKYRAYDDDGYAVGAFWNGGKFVDFGYGPQYDEYGAEVSGYGGNERGAYKGDKYGGKILGGDGGVGGWYDNDVSSHPSAWEGPDMPGAYPEDAGDWEYVCSEGEECGYPDRSGHGASQWSV
ncbi:hypothetical protein BJ508DRAFT_373787 [Ascobolus immersus RN42]|uniref:Uncharacterized protein n=1 Tax=Ascobolus immersus RN42 TaxID=1160509 RepID=A0A3N4IHF4_ASCIM|nr:hypothetical protein BJ508DRAFT_373787 [Ascobolus immersus RN42]